MTTGLVLGHALILAPFLSLILAIGPLGTSPHYSRTDYDAAGGERGGDRGMGPRTAASSLAIGRRRRFLLSAGVGVAGGEGGLPPPPPPPRAPRTIIEWRVRE